MDVNASTEIYCIFGNPVKHSLSPIIHNTSFHELKINACYLAFEPVGIQQAIEAMKHLNILGASITIPFKVDAMSYVDEIDEIAMKIGSINTLKNVNGWIKAYNTDGEGAIKAVLKKHQNIKGKNILILGNGGSSRAIAYSALLHGAEVIISGRNHERVDALSKDLQKHGTSRAIVLNELNKSLMQDVNIIINTTPLGMSPDINQMPIREELLMKHHTVFDIVYSPVKTRLLDEAQKRGCICIGGIEMLLNQALMQFNIWTGRKAPEEK